MLSELSVKARTLNLQLGQDVLLAAETMGHSISWCITADMMSWLIVLAKLCMLDWGGRGPGVVRSEIRNHSSSSCARSLGKLQQLLLAAGSAQAVLAGVPLHRYFPFTCYCPAGQQQGWVRAMHQCLL